MDLQNTDRFGPRASTEASGFVSRAGIGLTEFILLVAALSSVVALSIDIMLPVLPEIGDTYGIPFDNDRQAVIVAFVLGFGLAQIVFGPLSDRFGRNTVLIPAIVFYGLASVAAALADNFTWLLVLRLAQGIGAAAVRVMVNAIVRDCFGGREMARIMSYAFMIFMIVPIIAPALGQWIAFISSWQWIFVVLGATACTLAIWSSLRLKETLPSSERLPFSLSAFASAFRQVISNRQAMGYTVSGTLCVSCMFSFIVCSQQIFDTVYGLGAWFPYAFASVGVIMALVNFANSILVRRLGMRFISHSALIIFTVLGTLMLILVTVFGHLPFWLAYLLLSANIGAFALVPPNFNSIAMEPLGHVAGTASSVIGLITFTGGGVLGGFVGQSFDGTLVPLATGFTVFAWTALAIVLWTERGRLFTRSSDL